MTVFINTIDIQSASDEQLAIWKNQGLSVKKTGDDIHIDFKPSKATALNNEFNLNMAQSPTGKLKAKAEVELNHTFKTSIDQEGSIEAGLNLKF